METTHVGKLAGLSKRVNDRLMTMKLPLSIQKKKKKHVTIISTYAPSMTNPEEVIYTPSWPLFQKLTSSSFSVTSMQEQALTVCPETLTMCPGILRMCPGTGS